jgi:magnesium transporter
MQASISIPPGHVLAAEFPTNSVGQLTDPVFAAFPPELTVADCVESIRELVKLQFVTYAYVVDSSRRLLGLVTTRDLLLATPTDRLDAIMLRDVFTLRPETDQLEAMRSVLDKHFPCYPVCDADGTLLGLVWGHRLFQAQTFELSTQAGAMVGVEREERLTTPLRRSLRFRHHWLQINLLTAFVAAGVVGFYEDTINQFVLLAVFLPVLAGQSGNTGCQALAVTLRAMTLGEYKSGHGRVLIQKEGALGLLNGFLTGLTAGSGMFIYALLQHHPQALTLGLLTLVAMTGACMISGLCGAIVPMALRRFGADPATASSIFLTTCTDVVSMGLFLGLATLLL